MPHGDITHLDIPAEDVGRAQSFYSSLFGWQIADIPGYEGYPMWQAPNKISGGGITQRTEVVASPLSYVEVDSIEDILAKVDELGGRVIKKREPISETSWWAVLEDSEGNKIGLYEGVTSTGDDTSG